MYQPFGQLKMDHDPDIKAKTIKPLEENKYNLHNPRDGQKFPR